MVRVGPAEAVGERDQQSVGGDGDRVAYAVGLADEAGEQPVERLRVVVHVDGHASPPLPVVSVTALSVTAVSAAARSEARPAARSEARSAAPLPPAVFSFSTL